MLKKMGYGGKGLRKSGNGITYPVTIEKKNMFNPIDKEEVVNNAQWTKGTTLITGSSIISGIAEKVSIKKAQR